METLEQHWEEEDLVMISGIQHFSYCPRQWALIHREQVFEENVFTLQGRFAHENADEEKVRMEGTKQIVSGLAVWSTRLGLTGKCDVVEIQNRDIFPIEYKHGKRKSQVHDELQLCAQAICLEEMFQTNIETGAIYHISSKARREVPFTASLRLQVEQVVQQIREWSQREELPPAVNDKRCTHCSLQDACLPHLTDGKRTKNWKRTIGEAE
ncbi:CRISPR-associated protein Cas4 [Tumebacillus lipolyticus]|uniref:CRISPR-associated exonuclease Cas4 n=1 Tax=Tumebacillus lipolyticus TaxID=1280370 RepID=A0ABW4ZYU4_9BACL